MISKQLEDVLECAPSADGGSRAVTLTPAMRIRLDIYAEILAGVWDESKGDPGDVPDFRGCDLSGAPLAGRDLRRLIFHRTDCREADFRGSDLRGCLFNHACLFRADLRGCDLRGTNFFHADLQLARLRGARLNWYSQELIGEILWRAAGRHSGRRMLAALAGRRMWCWRDWAKADVPWMRWAVRVLARWVQPGDKLPGELAARIGGDVLAA